MASKLSYLQSPTDFTRMSTYQRVVIAGVGLIGGSIGLALRERKLAQNIVGFVRSDASGKRALDCGVVDLVSTDPVIAANEAEVVIVCAPVGSVVETTRQLAPHCPATALVTDAGSTKAEIVQQAESTLSGLPAAPLFVGSHPIAGDHRTGPESARPNLFEGRTVVVTPTDQTPAEATDRATQFWESLGATVVTQSPQEHDAALARTSHLPHLVATVLARATPAEALPFAASGWADTTRVAAASPELWQDILLTNREELMEALAVLEEGFAEFHAVLKSGDSDRLLHLLDEGKRRRDALGS